MQFDGKTLIGEYPTGRLFEFDGRTVRPSPLTPPDFSDGIPNASESQTLAVHCGNLFVGYWPHAALYRYDGSHWKEPITFFPSRTETFPHTKEAEAAGQIFNFLGQRVSSLISHEGSLYAITSNKGDWNASIDIPIPEADLYGMTYKIDIDGCE